jgi:hypothetical protein
MESAAFETDLVCLPDIDVSALGIVGSVRKRALQVMIDEINQLRAHRSIAKAEMKFIKEQVRLITLSRLELLLIMRAFISWLWRLYTV